ncbi:uncharacterized protein LOC141594994 [Silene latifolia]|uniref:uncharacterized protein LOC141594994 n=1 Tax=Silene latifolia TaxID=37657 RepID=UPI003D773A37
MSDRAHKVRNFISLTEAMFNYYFIKKSGIPVLLKHVEELQEQIGKDPSNLQLITKEYKASKELKELSIARDSFLSQKSKSLWIKEGDTNSAYFHGLLKKRRNENKVVMGPGRTQYRYVKISLSRDLARCNVEHYVSLLKPVTTKEIGDTLFSIPDIKSPGQDGYTNKIFKDSWGEIGGDVISVVMDFFHQGKLLKQLNAANLTLIPKCERPQSVLEFRPISCCNVVYRVISKFLCARLVEDLIRLYERPNATPRCMFRIHLQKAYDTVEWTFVDQLMDMLKFPVKFKEIIMQCITVTFT